MIQQVDLNADMGESYGLWHKGHDTALLDVITSANIACGFHAGDWDVMDQAMRLAVSRGVGIGAHPGFPDLHGFGRRRMVMENASLSNLIAYQVGAAQGVARKAGGVVRHVKLHGALANMASEDKALAEVCYRSVLALGSEIVLVVLAGTAQQQAAADLNCRFACEIFADRAYNDDATLVDRSQQGAVIADVHEACHRTVAMVKAGAIITQSGKRIPGRIDTICTHGDTLHAVDIAKTLRRALEQEGITIATF